MNEFDQDVFRQKLYNWIIRTDQAFHVTEQASFQEMIKYCNPRAKVLGGDTIKRDLMDRFVENRTILSNELSVSQWMILISTATTMLMFTFILVYWQALESRISITLDMWKSAGNDDYMAITGHYIDDKWSLQSLLLDFVHIESSHTGENMARAFMDSMNEMQISSKV